MLQWCWAVFVVVKLIYLVLYIFTQVKLIKTLWDMCSLKSILDKEKKTKNDLIHWFSRKYFYTLIYCFAMTDSANQILFYH